MRRLWIIYRCVVRGHNFRFVSRTDDWLFGGEYTYQCTRCGTFKTTSPYQGNI